ncbi:MAG: hypothetical protein JSV64_05475 [Candidatus Bathyarchaeota archaeon]|nr:MAG: hypothetical protein JSV64_05475 [Candidatus Bathyarchaeota archaeon]
MRKIVSVLILILLFSSSVFPFHSRGVEFPDTFSAESQFAPRTPGPWSDWSHYHNYSEIIDSLLFLNLTYPDIVDVFSIGDSWLGRTIYCIRLTNESITRPKPKLLFVGYHHAREPISAELALYFVVDAATRYSTSPTLAELVDETELYVVVALNIDAFEVVNQNAWQRKNIHPIDEDGDSFFDEDPPDDADGDGYIEDLIFWNGTYYEFLRWEGLDDDSDGSFNEDWVGGVDLNRNYGYEWNASVDSGSPDPRDEDYRGPAPFSEPETQAMRDFALQHDFKYSVSLHSGAEMVIYPWGYSANPPTDVIVFNEMASDLATLTSSAYQQGGTWYTTSGVWEDWMYGNRCSFAFTCEIYMNDSAWHYEPGPDPDTFWESRIFEYFNPDPTQIETVIQQWFPIFTYLSSRAMEHDILGDADGDRDIDIFDIVRMATVYGVAEPHPDYDPACDWDSDGDIDIFDIVAAASNYGAIWQP